MRSRKMDYENQRLSEILNETGLKNIFKEIDEANTAKLQYTSEKIQTDHDCSMKDI